MEIKIIGLLFEFIDPATQTIDVISIPYPSSSPGLLIRVHFGGS